MQQKNLKKVKFLDFFPKNYPCQGLRALGVEEKYIGDKFSWARNIASESILC